mmetsp:Transcript_29271/g.95392  ORF Transcript_29271/g.95392 Transcript_29271/m.95392 type:complete len:1013 (-) Transcript_29271:2103-5141(-)
MALPRTTSAGIGFWRENVFKNAGVQNAVKGIFDLVDKDKNGWLDLSELKLLCSALGQIFDVKIDTDQLAGRVLAFLGLNNGGRVTLAQFHSYVENCPQDFGPLCMWHHLFVKYATKPASDSALYIWPIGALQLVSEIATLNPNTPFMTPDQRQYQASEMIRSADKDGNGCIDFTEFVQFALKNQEYFGRLLGEARQELGLGDFSNDLKEMVSVSPDSHPALEKLFKAIDQDKSGTLDFLELCTLITEVGLTYGEEKARSEIEALAMQMLDYFKKGATGALTLPEFEKYALNYPAAFSKLMVWQTVFMEFADQTTPPTIGLSAAVRLVESIAAINGMPMMLGEAHRHAAELIQRASGSANASQISYHDFVAYARTNSFFDTKVSRVQEKIDMSNTEAAKALKAMSNDVLAQPGIAGVIKRLFKRVDKDGSGLLDISEVQNLLSEVYYVTGEQVKQYSEIHSHAKSIFDFLQKSTQATITLGEFEQYIAAKPQDFGPILVWQQLFAQYVANDEMTEIEAENLILAHLRATGEIPIGVAPNREHLNRIHVVKSNMFTTCDVDGSGTISFGEFMLYATNHPELFGQLKAGAITALNSIHAGIQSRNVIPSANPNTALQQLFHSADVDKSGMLDVTELGRLWRMVLESYGQSISEADAAAKASATMSELGKGADATISLPEFEAYCASQPQLFGPLMTWQQLFTRYASSGGLDFEGAQKLLLECFKAKGIQVTDVDTYARHFMAAADHYQRGRVSFDEFVKVASRPENEKVFGELSKATQAKVDRMLKVVTLRRLREASVQELKDIQNRPFLDRTLWQLFTRFDEDGGQSLDSLELQKLCRDIARLNKREMTEQQIAEQAGQILAFLEKRLDEKVSFPEFEFFVREHGQEFEALLLMQALFGSFANEKAGVIDIIGAKRLFRQIWAERIKKQGGVINDMLVERDAQGFMQAADLVSGGTQVGFEAFCIFVQNHPAIEGDFRALIDVCREALSSPTNTSRKRGFGDDAGGNAAKRQAL